jgi:TetR/AcrR family transcriptional regulator
MDTQSIILETALQLFASRGYDAVGVQEITAKSGITKPTLYYYFGSKKGLLEAIITEYSRRLSSIIHQSVMYRGDLSVNLEALATGYFQFAKEHAIFYRMQLAMYFAPPDSEPNQLVRPTNEAQHRLIAELFSQAACHQAAKPFAISHPEYFSALAATFIGTINTYIGFALNGYLEFSQTLAHQAVHQFLHGIYHNPNQEVQNDERFAG